MPFPRSHGVLLFLLLAAGPAALRAEGPDDLPKAELEPPIAWGLQGYLARPLLDLRAMGPRSGQGGGLFMEQRLTSSSFLQTRFDYSSYRQVDGLPTPNAFNPVPANVTSMAANAASLGADLRLYLPYPGLQSVYILGGMAAVRYEFRALATVTSLDPNGIPLPAAPIEVKAKTSMKWGVDAGLGWELGRGVALTVRYTYVPIDGDALAALESGLRITF